MKRRQFLRNAGASLAAVSAGTAVAAGGPLQTVPDVRVSTASSPLAEGVTALAFQPQTPIRLAPIRAQSDRLTGIYVCTRPFRARGPRIESERLGRKTIVHNYGHGGSGWSLSWGSSTLAVALAKASAEKRIGVIGCGALGLTSALVAQRAGLKVRIYAKELPPDVRSSRATGLWTPDSRICEAIFADEQAARWEQMARTSHAVYQSWLGLPGQPVQWIDGYALSDQPFGTPEPPSTDEPHYADFHHLVRDLTPQSQELAPGTHPFAQAYVKRYTTMMFNISTYARLLMEQFQAAGGQIEVREFAQAHELQKLPEKTLINATGYGARALFGDDSIVPVRGQTARLIPQPEVTYALSTHHFGMIPRSDGLLVQSYDDAGSYNNTDTTPDRAASELAVQQLAKLVASMRATA